MFTPDLINRTRLVDITTIQTDAFISSIKEKGEIYTNLCFYWHWLNKYIRVSIDLSTAKIFY